MQKIIIAGQIHESEAVDMSVTVKCFLVEMKVHSMIQKQKAIEEMQKIIMSEKSLCVTDRLKEIAKKHNSKKIVLHKCR